MLVEIHPYSDKESKGVLDSFSVNLGGIPSINDHIIIQRFDDGTRALTDEFQGKEEYRVDRVNWLGWLTMSGHLDDTNDRAVDGSHKSHCSRQCRSKILHSCFCKTILSREIIKIIYR